MPNIYKPIPVNVVLEGGEDMLSRIQLRHHRIASDEAANMGGGDSAPAPLEYFLASMVACSNAIMRRIADQAGIKIVETHFELNSHLDPEGVWDYVPDWHPFPEIRVKVRVKGPANESELSRLKEKVARHCPVEVILRRSGATVSEDWELIPD